MGPNQDDTQNPTPGGTQDQGGVPVQPIGGDTTQTPPVAEEAPAQPAEGGDTTGGDGGTGGETPAGGSAPVV